MKKGCERFYYPRDCARSHPANRWQILTLELLLAEELQTWLHFLLDASNVAVIFVIIAIACGRAYLLLATATIAKSFYPVKESDTPSLRFILVL